MMRRIAAAAILATIVPCLAMASTTLNGSGTMSATYQALAPSTTENSVGTSYTLAVPGTYNFGDSSLANLGTVTPFAATSVGTYDFQDSYVFTIGSTAGGDTAVFSLANGSAQVISDLQYRLYEVTSAAVLPVVGSVPTGSTVVQTWSGVSGTVPLAVISNTFSGIQAGTYILDVAGTASGTAAPSAGSYTGSLNLTPVPLPAAAWLLLSGLGGLGAMVRKRRNPA